MDETKKTSVMKTNLKFKPKAGYVYVVTNECLKLVKAKGVFRGKMVKPVKIGNAKDFTSRLGSLNTAVYENFDFHLGIKTDDVVGLEGIIHTALQDYRIYTRDGDATEFFACPLDEVVGRIKNLIVRGHKMDIEEYKGGKVVGRCSPKTQRIASETLLLPHPFGPTIAIIPSSKVRRVLSAKLLKPCISNVFKYIVEA